MSKIINSNSEIALLKWSNQVIARDQIDKIKIKNTSKLSDGYLEVWDKNYNLIDKYYFNEVDKLELNINSNVGILIKHIKINDKYQAIWRVDIK